MQKNIKVVVLLVAIIFGFCLVRDFLIKSIIGTTISSVTGAPTHIGGLSLSIIKQSVRISDLKLYNPTGFPKDVLVDIPKINVACNMGALLKGKIHLKQLDIDLKELGLAKNKEGKLNVNSLKTAEGQKGEKKKTDQKPASEMKIQMDVVNLSLGRVVDKDYSVEGSALTKVYDINLKKTYKNITSVQQLAALIVAEPLKAAGIQGAKAYGATMLTGVAALPVAAVFTFTGKDHAEADYNVSWSRAYEIGIKQLQKAGKIKKENKQTGVVTADVSGVGVTLKLTKIADNKTHIVVSARKFGLPKPEISAGILSGISNELK
ncbi:MAG: AsmA family protein [Candidatus Omnitrophica bacterium]|nr:AsmA family protein [Candidatus Omnitrophota bacterium]